MRISFVIPCYNCALSIGTVIEDLKKKMEEMQTEEYQVILVNDASPQETLSTLRQLAQVYPFVTVIDLAKNFGQHAAIMAGLRETTGEVVVCLDDDGQTPIDEVDKLLSALGDDCDVAYASYTTKACGFGRNIGSKINDKMLCFLLDKPKDLYLSSYFAAKRFVIDKVLEYTQPYPYLMGLILRSTRYIKNVEVTHHKRENGKSGYTLKKLISLWVNGLTNFSVKPLRLASLMGLVFALIGFIMVIVTVVLRFVRDYTLLGWTSTVAIILLLGGLLLIMLGVMGEYVGRSYLCLNHQPQYVVRTIEYAKVREKQDE